MDIMIECVGKGTIMDAHNFLGQRKHNVTAKCLNKVIYYEISYQSVVKVAKIYPSLSVAFKAAQSQSQFDSIMDLNLVDYQETDFNFEEKYPCVNATEKEIAKIPDLRLKLKNAVLHWLFNRRIS